MNNEIWHRPGWMKRIAKEIHPLKDIESRRSIINLYKAILNRLKEKNSSAVTVVKLEQHIVVQCEKVLQQYKSVVAEKVDPVIIGERSKVSLITKQLFERAYQHINADEDEMFKLEQIMADFAFLSWPGLTAV